MTATVGAGLAGVVDDLARTATTISENSPIGEAWTRLHADPDRCGVVLRGHVPIAVLTAGDLAERWPGGGPLVSWSRPVTSILTRPVGVETVGRGVPLARAARQLLASGLPALPVTGPGAEPRVLTLRALLTAAVEAVPACMSEEGW